MGESNPVKYLICGGFGGICTILSGHPLDTIKVRLQTMPTPPPGQPPLYAGTVDCAKKIMAKEGFTGLFKGMSAPLVGVTPMFALSFFGFGLGKSLIQTAPNVPLTNPQLFAAGAFSGVLTTIIAAPVERMKCLLQMQEGAGEKKYNGMFDCAKKLYKEGGIASVYKGTCATLLRDIPGAGTYFLTYEFCQKVFKKSFGNDVGLMAAVASGGFSGITFWIVSMPADVLKSRLQTAPEGTYPNGIRGVFKELMAKEGAGALYKGVAPVMLRALPANAACFFGFELCMKFLTSFGF